MTARRPGPVSTTLGVIGVVLYAAAGVLYIASGLVVPAPWFVLMWAIWLIGMYPLYLVFRGPRLWTPVVAVLAAGLWVLIVAIGEALFGWTA